MPLPPGGTVKLQASAQLANGATVETRLKEVRDPVVFTQKFGYKLDYGLYIWTTAVGTNGFATHHNEFQEPTRRSGPRCIMTARHLRVT